MNELIFKINNKQKLNAIVIDNFYEDPIKVREFALSQKIDITGCFPGTRTAPYVSTDIKNKIQKIVGSYGKNCNMYLDYNDEENEKNNNNNNGSFFINTINSENAWIHNDSEMSYSCIIYLTPNVSLSSGTSVLTPLDDKIKQDRKTGIDKTKWIEIDRIGNKFNKMLIFDCQQYHVPNNYFGIDKEDGRLTQVIWFNFSKTPEKSVERNSPYPCNLSSKHTCDFIVIDDFYEDPTKVREFALSQKFHITGDFLGSRTDCFITNDIIKKIESYLYQYDVDMTKIRSPRFGSGSFQYITSKYKPEVYIDNNSDWSGIIFLTPDANEKAGIRFYDYHDINSTLEIMKKYSKDMTKWNETDKIYHKFNRLILFNSKKWHSMAEHFGLDQYDSGLFQMFFI